MQEGAFPEDPRGLGDPRSTVGLELKADTTAGVSRDKRPPGAPCAWTDAKSPKSEVAGAVMEGTLSQNQKLPRARGGAGRGQRSLLRSHGQALLVSATQESGEVPKKVKLGREGSQRGVLTTVASLAESRLGPGLGERWGGWWGGRGQCHGWMFCL